MNLLSALNTWRRSNVELSSRVEHQADGARVDRGERDSVAAREANGFVDVMCGRALGAIGEMRARSDGLSIESCDVARSRRDD